MIALAHIFGIPVEETLPGILPIGAVVLGAGACAARARLRSVRRRRLIVAASSAKRAPRSGNTSE